VDKYVVKLQECELSQRHFVATHRPASKKPSPTNTGVLVVSQMTYRDRIANTPMARSTSMTTGTHRGLS
jgi:hypothetical protein